MTDAEEAKSYLENLLQDSLSGDDHFVRVTGFSGALSSQAQMQLLTIADGDGIWLTMRDAKLDWTRSALLRGHLQIQELSATEITIERLPDGGDAAITTESAEASTFALPDLPVSVNIDRVAIGRVLLGEPVIGEAATLSVEGAVTLDEGDGRAKLDVQRLDRDDEVVFEGSFSNESRVLALALNVNEASDGLVTQLMRIPGGPALTLQVSGEAPLSDYTARIALSSDGVRRFGGTVRIAAEVEEDEIAGYAFGAALEGDVRPLFTPELHPFFGENSELALAGNSFADGRVVLDTLELSSGAMQVDGMLALSSAGWPERFNLSGRVQGDEPVRLPLSGPETIVNSAKFVASYDEEDGETWTTTVEIYGLLRDGLSIGGVQVKGNGSIGTRPLQEIGADLTYAVAGIGHTDEGLNDALGRNADGVLKIDWTPDSPIEIEGFELITGGTKLVAKGTVDNLESGLTTTGEATLLSSDLTRFQKLVDRRISGSAEARLTGEIALLGGAFAMEMTATTLDLQIDEPRVDPLLTGRSTLEISAARTTEGTVLRNLRVENDAVNATASGRLDAEAGQLELKARLAALDLVEPRLSGPATVDSAFRWQSGQGITISRLTATAAAAEITAEGTVDPENASLPVAGTITLDASDLTRFAELAGRPLSGSIDMQLTGSGVVRRQSFDAKLKSTSTDLNVGEPRVDRLMQGTTTLDISAKHDAAGSLLRRFEIENASLKASATGELDEDSGALELIADMADVARVEPRLSGPASVDGVFSWRDGDGIRIERMVSSVAGADITAEGKADPQDPAFPFDGSLSVKAQDLSRFAQLAKMPMTGSIDLSVDGSGKINDRVFDIGGAFDASNFRSGLAELDRLIAGPVSAAFSGSVGEGPPDLKYLKLDTSRLKINASGDGPGQPIAFSGRLSDLGLFVPDFAGPVTARGTMTVRDSEGRQTAVNLDATGPGGTTARIAGTINDYGKSLNLDVQGQAPLGLANRFIQPRSVQGQAQFNLNVNGPPSLNSLSGSATFEGARVALPTLNYALNNLTGGAQLAAGRAEVNVTGDAGTGGQFRVTGPIQLTSPFPANLTIALNNLGLFDPTLYQTTLGGSVTLSGNLTGGALIGGAILLGPTELRVPSGSGSISGTLLDIKHLYEPQAVRTTRDRAGLIEKISKSPAVFPIDLVINAPNRIFVRGRGLDAELGGSVRLTGTTADIRPSGVFELIRGRLDILGKRLDLTQGLIDLRGALDPYLRFVAETTADDIDVRVIIEGLASEPEVTFESSPELPQEEVVARLLFGRDIASMSAFQAAQLVSAVATLSGRYSGGFTGRLRDSLGLSDLDVTTTDDGATQFRAGAYISENIYSEVIADSDGNEEINLNIDLSRSFTVKGSVSSEGNTGIGIFFEKDY